MSRFEAKLSELDYEIVQRTRTLILSSDDRLEERTAYSIPFFYLNKKRLFYINSDQKKKHLVLGFCQGAQLDPDEDILNGKSTSVRHYDLKNLEALANPDLRAMIMEAIHLMER